MQLVEIKKLDLVANTMVITEGVKKYHDTIIKLVDRNKADLEEFGPLGFEICMVERSQGGGKKLPGLIERRERELYLSGLGCVP
ncbi:hypothetical protein [Symbiopectobacterium sp. RP]|uniref:hypothetical protein n=1 Tax=Symbiopectobacterium sp. RP TaxID=3248553 RepID=UPI003D281E0E